MCLQITYPSSNKMCLHFSRRFCGLNVSPLMKSSSTQKHYINFLSCHPNPCSLFPHPRFCSCYTWFSEEIYISSISNPRAQLTDFFYEALVWHAFISQQSQETEEFTRAVWSQETPISKPLFEQLIAFWPHLQCSVLKVTWKSTWNQDIHIYTNMHKTAQQHIHDMRQRLHAMHIYGALGTSHW